MKVIHVVPAVAPRYGGPSEAGLKMVCALEGAGVESLLVTTNADGPARLPVDLGVETSYGGARTIFFPRFLGESLKFSPEMARWLERNASRYDLFHVHSVFSHSSLCAGAAARKAGLPYVVRPLGQLDRWSLAQHRLRKKVFLAAGGRRLLEEAAGIHWTADPERENAPDFARLRPSFVGPLGVDEGLFSGIKQASVRSSVVLFLSRLHPKKNVEALLEAFLAAGEAAHRWKLVIAGDGEPEYVDSLRRLVARSDGRDRVELTGWLTGPEKARALLEASLLALPSRQENFGIVVAEAMAAGTPVLVSENVALSGEVSRGAAGWVVSLEGDALRAALVEAMTSPEERRRRGAAARTLAESRYRWSAVAGKLRTEYERILTGRRAA